MGDNGPSTSRAAPPAPRPSLRMTNRLQNATLNKVPAVTAAFWVIKILATTLGETGGDSLSMSLQLGYLLSTFIFLGFFVVTLSAQLRTKSFHPLAYWAVVVATTTVGTTTSDYLDRTLGLGYVKSSALLLLAVIVVLDRVALRHRLDLGRPHRHAAQRDLLLGDDPDLEHARHRPR